MSAWATPHSAFLISLSSKLASRTNSSRLIESAKCDEVHLDRTVRSLLALALPMYACQTFCNQIMQTSQSVMKKSHGLSIVVLDRRFIRLFLVALKATSVFWVKLKSNSDLKRNRFKYHYLLWSLLFLRCYPSEEFYCYVTQSDGKLSGSGSESWCLSFLSLK